MLKYHILEEPTDACNMVNLYTIAMNQVIYWTVTENQEKKQAKLCFSFASDIFVRFISWIHRWIRLSNASEI